MPYKKWIILLFTMSTTLYALIFLIYILVDPEQVFNKSITQHKFRYTKYYSKHQYEKLKKDKYILIFGTSRSQKVSTNVLGINLLNFHNMGGEPSDIFNFLKQLNSQQIVNIKHIYCLVSTGSMRDEISTLNYKKYGFIDKFNEVFPLTNSSLKNLTRDILNNIQEKSIYYINNDGSQFVYNKNQTAIVNRTIQQPINEDLMNTNSFKELLKINEFCKKNNIKTTYYTPTYVDKYKINIKQITFLWQQLFNGGIDGFYALYYLEDISNNMIKNQYIHFTDKSHLNHTSMNNIFKNIVLDENKTYFIENTQQLNTYLKTYNK